MARQRDPLLYFIIGSTVTSVMYYGLFHVFSHFHILLNELAMGLTQLGQATVYAVLFFICRGRSPKG